MRAISRPHSWRHSIVQTTLSSELWTCRPPSKPPGEKMRRNKTVIVIRIVVALLILYAIVGLIRKTVSAPVLGNGGGYTSGVIALDPQGAFLGSSNATPHPGAKRGDGVMSTGISCRRPS